MVCRSQGAKWTWAVQVSAPWCPFSGNCHSLPCPEMMEKDSWLLVKPEVKDSQFFQMDICSTCSFYPNCDFCPSFVNPDSLFHFLFNSPFSFSLFLIFSVFLFPSFFSLKILISPVFFRDSFYMLLKMLRWKWLGHFCLVDAGFELYNWGSSAALLSTYLSGFKSITLVLPSPGVSLKIK